ncbi:MAG: hypothetical protein ACJ77M_15305 [Thermoleophilaceae bacterium]
MSPRDSVAGPLAATVALLIPLAVLDRRMQSTGGPGIIPFELAGPDGGPKIMQRWGSDGRRAARASLVLDFPFLAAYTTLNVRLAARAGGALAPAVAATQVAAGACDAVENTALLGVLARGGDARLSVVARTAARIKFAGLYAGWLYFLVALVRAAASRGS